MKRVSNAYKMAMSKMVRDHTYMICSIGVISNEAQGSARVISPMHYLSNNTILFKDREGVGQYATFEENATLADGTTYFPPQNDENLQLLSETSALSRDLMGSIKVRFDNYYDIKGLTLRFGHNYPISFSVVINDTDSYTYSNSAETFETMDNFDGTQSITITPIEFVDGAQKRLRIESMLMGIGLVFRSEDIQSSSLTDGTSFVSAQLPQLDFEVTCLDKNKWFNIDDSSSFINYLQTGQMMEVTIGMELEDSSIEWVQMAPTYLTKWSSDTEKVKFNCSDKLRVFMAEKYESGNYIHERTAYDEAHAVCISAGLEPDEYIIDDILRSVTLLNPMPVVGHNEALQLLANISRCSLKEDSFGRVIIMPNFENIIEPEDLEVYTDSEAAWSKPSNIRIGSNIVYADFTRNFASANGSMYFIPTNSEYLESGFVSSEIADENGDFDTNPSVEIVLPARYTYFGMNFEFAGNPPQQFTIRTYDDDELLDEVVINNPENEEYVYHEFYSFDRMTIEFNKGMPLNRVVMQKAVFADMTDYRLTFRDMKTNVGTMETKVRDVRVKVFTFENQEQEIDGETVITPQQVDDSVYYTENVNNVGEVITFENPLINTMEQAQRVAEWLANYYANNITYSVDYRGDPRIESSDYLYMESEIINNLQVEVDSHTLKYDGALSGTLKLRRAINMMQ